MLIVVDTLRADHLGAYGSRRRTSPHLDRLQGGSWLRFERAFAHSPWTLPSFASMLTSLPPPVHKAGSRFTGRSSDAPVVMQLRDSIRTAPEILREEHGFRTAAFVNNVYLNPQFGLDAGFEHYDHEDGSNVRSRRASVMVDAAMQWLGALREGERFFTLVHLFDPHLDYDPPAPFGEAWLGEGAATDRPDPELYARMILEGYEPGPEAKDLAERLYDGEIAYVDEQIGRLLAGLEELGLADSTAIFITADHGEEFWDHGGFEHGHSLYGELVRVPLWLKLPVGTAAHAPVGAVDGVIDDLFCQVDLLPTLLDVLDLETTAPLLGRSFFAPDSAANSCYLGATLYGRRLHGIVEGDLKLIRDKATGVAELYDLADDPRELRNLADRRPEELARLLGVLEQLETELRRLGASAGRSEPAPLDDQTLERLKSMGYIR